MTERYTYQENHIVHDDFGDEVVTINLKNGVYYSFANSGRTIWLLLKNSPSLDSLLQKLAKIYEINLPDIREQVQEFLDKLIKEELIYIHEFSGSDPGAEEADEDLQAQLGENLPFDPPALNSYSDQQELLLLDPIHEVAELGWPEKKS